MWELSGRDAEWLTPSTRSRVRARIRNAQAEDIARAVSGRTHAHRFRAANATKAATGLIATGRAAASVLGVGLMNDTRQVCGYTRRESAGDYALKNFMVADSSGHDVIYDNTLPIDYAAGVMPTAVIAADLAVSTDTRERSGGLRGLDDLRRTWLASH